MDKFIVQMRHKGKTHEVWDETIPLESQFDAENHIEIDRSGISPKDERYEYRVVQVTKDWY